MVFDLADIDDPGIEEGFHPGTEPTLVDVGHVGQNVEMGSTALSALEYGQEPESLSFERGADLPAEFSPCVYQSSSFKVRIITLLEGNS